MVIALVLTLILGTILLRMTWLNKNHVADIIQGYLTTTDQSLSGDQSVVLAKQIRKPKWNRHFYLSYLLVGVLVVRYLFSLFGNMKFPHPFKKQLSLKVKFQKWIYLIFYVLVTISIITGLIIEFGSGDFVKPMKIVHKLSLHYLIPFIVIHLTGVLVKWYLDRKIKPTL